MSGGEGSHRPLPVQPVTATELLIAELIFEIRLLRGEIARYDQRLADAAPISPTLHVLEEPVRAGGSKKKR